MKKILITCIFFCWENCLVTFNYLRNLAIILSFLPLHTIGASHDFDSTLWKKAIVAESQFQEPLALRYYLRILAHEPENVDALVKASRLYLRIGGRSVKRTDKAQHVLKGKVLACEAIELAPKNVEAHFQYVVALGLLAEMADHPREKLENARLIKKECEIVLQLDSAYAPAYFVLGKWHQALSKLNWLEKTVAETLFGGVPEGASVDEAHRCFQRALQLQPDFILFNLNMARLLSDQRKFVQSRDILSYAIQLPEKEPDDLIRKENCRQLLVKVQHNLQNP